MKVSRHRATLQERLAALRVYKRCSRQPAVMSHHSLVGSQHAVAGAAMSAAAAACRAGPPYG